MQLLVSECQIKDFLAYQRIFVENLIEFAELKENYLIEMLRFELPVLSLYICEISLISKWYVKCCGIIIWMASWTLVRIFTISRLGKKRNLIHLLVILVYELFSEGRILLISR